MNGDLLLISANDESISKDVQDYYDFYSLEQESQNIKHLLGTCV